MKIIQIEDSYIDLLRKEFPHVMFSKKHYRKHTRKYFGVVLMVNNFNYYVPLSSPKPHDFTSKGDIRTDDLYTIRIVEPDGDGKKKLLGTLKLNCMIPVPLKYVCGYSLENEEDINYANLVASELKWINKNQAYIVGKAEKIYKFKMKNLENNKDCVLPFQTIETYLAENKLL